MVNILCHKAMMAAYGQGQKQVDLNQVKMATRDTEDATQIGMTLLMGKSFYCVIGAITLLEIILIVYLLRSVMS